MEDFKNFYLENSPQFAKTESIVKSFTFNHESSNEKKNCKMDNFLKKPPSKILNNKLNFLKKKKNSFDKIRNSFKDLRKKFTRSSLFEIENYKSNDIKIEIGKKNNKNYEKNLNKKIFKKIDRDQKIILKNEEKRDLKENTLKIKLKENRDFTEIKEKNNSSNDLKLVKKIVNNVLLKNLNEIEKKKLLDNLKNNNFDKEDNLKKIKKFSNKNLRLFKDGNFEDFKNKNFTAIINFENSTKKIKFCLNDDIYKISRNFCEENNLSEEKFEKLHNLLNRKKELILKKNKLSIFN